MDVVRQDSAAAAQAHMLAQAVAGDTAAARSLARDLGGRAYAQAFRMLGNRAEAEDVVQDAMLRLWRVAPSWDAEGGAQVSSWLYRVVANLCIDRMRKGKGLSLDDDAVPDVPDQAPSVEAQMQTSARHQALQQALRELPDRQRQAVVLRHIEGMTNPEIADTMAVSIEAVESLTARAKRALSKALAGRKTELGFDDDTAI